jgi:hypothetical protein
MKTITAFAGIIILLIALVATPVSAGLTFASSSPQTIAEGDAFTMSGNGATNGSIAVIAFGRNYFHTFAVTPDSQGGYSLTLSPNQTQNFQSGQYAFVIVDPGANQQFEITAHVSEAGNITITDRGVLVADLGPVDNLGPGIQPAVEAFQSATERSGVDDILTPAYFFVELPFVNFAGTLDPATGLLTPARGADRRFIFTGTTNIGSENVLTAGIYNLSTGRRVMTVPVSAIVPGINEEKNSWTFGLDPSGLAPGEYYADVGWQKEKTCGHGTALFVVTADTTSPRQSDLVLPVFQLLTAASLPDKGALSLP